MLSASPLSVKCFETKTEYEIFNSCKIKCNYIQQLYAILHKHILLIGKNKIKKYLQL